MTELRLGPRRGCVAPPPSKSHAHRLLIANFLSGDRASLAADATDSDDIRATKRCLLALAEPTATPSLDCGESGSTLRFLAPIAAALGKRPTYIRRGRLAERPFRDYAALSAGVHELAGDVSSQFVTGLLFALPLLAGDSEIRFTSPLESRGYVDMTLDVLRASGVEIMEHPNGFGVRGRQTYLRQPNVVEGDWSGAAFWYGMNALGSSVEVTGLRSDSAQPDRAIATLAAELPGEVDVSQFPDVFPVLTVMAAGQPRRTVFVGIRRLRIKECDRVEAMRETLTRLGVGVKVSESSFEVLGRSAPFDGGEFRAFGDHRIAMSVAVAATRASSPVFLDDTACAAKSYPGFFSYFASLASIGVSNWCF